MAMAKLGVVIGIWSHGGLPPEPYDSHNAPRKKKSQCKKNQHLQMPDSPSDLVHPKKEIRAITTAPRLAE
jgi:hypothetical protein